MYLAKQRLAKLSLLSRVLSFRMLGYEFKTKKLDTKNDGSSTVNI
jgi:hypothetical protein